MAYYAKKQAATWSDIQQFQKQNDLQILIHHPVITAALDLHQDVRRACEHEKFLPKYQAWWDQVYRSSLSVATNFSEMLAKGYTLPYRIAVGESYECFTSLRACPIEDEELKKNLILKCKKIIDLLNQEVEKLVKGPDWDVKE